MNFSRWFRKIRKQRKRIKNFILKSFTFVNGMSLLFWIMVIDDIISWQPYLIIAFNMGWLWLMAYANGWVYDTEAYYERERKERHYDEM